MPLRRDALRFVDTALDVRSGLVGRIKLKIPVSKMRSEPWSIAMEKVYIIVGPQRCRTEPIGPSDLAPRDQLDSSVFNGLYSAGLRTMTRSKTRSWRWS